MPAFKSLIFSSVGLVWSSMSFADVYCQFEIAKGHFQPVEVSVHTSGIHANEPLQFSTYFKSGEKADIEGLRVQFRKAPVLIDEFDKTNWGMSGVFKTHTKVYGASFTVSADEFIGSEINGCIPQGIKSRTVYGICTDSKSVRAFNLQRLDSLTCDGMSEGKYLTMHRDLESGNLIFDIQKPMGPNLPAFASEKMYQLAVGDASHNQEGVNVTGAIEGMMFAGGGHADYSLNIRDSSEEGYNSTLTLNFNGWTAQTSETYQLSCQY